MGFMRIPSSMLTLNAIIQIKVNNFQYYHCYYVENHGQKKKKKRSTRVRERESANSCFSTKVFFFRYYLKPLSKKKRKKKLYISIRNKCQDKQLKPLKAIALLGQELLAESGGSGYCSYYKLCNSICIPLQIYHTDNDENYI